MFDSVRTRLTLWYATVLALSLIAFAVLVYYGAANIFYARQDELLRSTAETVASAYVQELEEEQDAVRKLVNGVPRHIAPLGGGPIGMNERQVLLQEAPHARAYPAKDLGQEPRDRTAHPFRRKTAAKCAEMIWNGLQHGFRRGLLR